jgi:hypothetical protein
MWPLRDLTHESVDTSLFFLGGSVAERRALQTNFELISDGFWSMQDD